MSNFSDIAAGLATTLAASIQGLIAYDWPVDSPGNQFPAAIIIPESLDPLIVFQGDTFEPIFRVIFLVSSADDANGFRQLYDYIDPTLVDKGLKQAIEADPTLDGSCDSSQLVRIERIGRRELGGGIYFGFDALVSVIKTVI